MKVILYMMNIKISSVSELNNTVKVLGGRKLLSVVVNLNHNDCKGSQLLYSKTINQAPEALN